MAREGHHFPDQTGSRWGQWALTAFRTNPRLGRSSVTRVAGKTTDETPAAPAAPSTHRHARRFSIVALSLVATAQGYTNDEANITGASLVIPPVLTTESSHEGGRLGRSRPEMFTGGSNGVGPEQRLIEGGKRERENDDFGLDVKPEQAADNTAFER